MLSTSPVPMPGELQAEPRIKRGRTVDIRRSQHDQIQSDVRHGGEVSDFPGCALSLPLHLSSSRDA
jgi:hypothetical protein